MGTPDKVLQSVVMRLTGDSCSALQSYKRLSGQPKHLELGRVAEADSPHRVG